MQILELLKQAEAKMNRQEIFNQAWLGLKAQGFERSMMERPPSGWQCAYRGADGRKCAIGHCIPDEAYDPKMEGHMAFDDIVRDTLGGFTDSLFLYTLQGRHDTGITPAEMESGLRRFALERGLTIPGEAA